MKKYSNQEIVSLILNFYTFAQGYWKEEIDSCIEIQKFIEDGYTYFDGQYPDLLKATDEGYNFLHCRIEEISQKFIHFMVENNLECSKEKVAEWFWREFDLVDLEMGEEIAKYIVCNLDHYGYRVCNLYSRRKGECYKIIELE